MLYKQVQIFIEGNLILRVTRSKAEKLYNAGYEVFLFPFNMKVNSIDNRHQGISKKNLVPFDQFDKVVDRFKYRYRGPELGPYPIFFVTATDLDKFNSMKK